MKILVCGSNWGTRYLEAIRAGGTHEVVGLLGRGSEKSLRIAKEFGIPFVTSVNEAPQADVACVAISGPSGTAISAELLRRGTSVLREHPVGQAALQTMLEAAREAGSKVHVNGHYGDFSPAKDFVDAARALRRVSEPLQLQVSVDAPFLYAMLDVLGRILGPLELSFDSSVARNVGPGGILPTITSVGMLNRIPINLFRGTSFGPRDDGSMEFFGQHVSLHFVRGRLDLADWDGVALFKRNTWAACMGIPAPANAPEATANLIVGRGLLVETVSPPAPQFIDSYVRQLRAMVDAVERLAAHASGGPEPEHQTEEYLVALIRAWRLCAEAPTSQFDATELLVNDGNRGDGSGSDSVQPSERKPSTAGA